MLASKQKASSRTASSSARTRAALSREMFIDIVVTVDLILVIASAFLIKYIYVGTDEDAGANYLTIIGLVTVALFAALGRRRHYSLDSFEKRDGWGEFSRLSFALVFSFGFAMFAIFLLKQSDQFSRVWVIAWCASVFLVLFAGKMLWSRRYAALCARGYFRRCVLLLGEGHALKHATASLLSARSHIHLAGVREIRSTKSGELGSISLNNALEYTVKRAQAGGLDEVAIALPASESRLLARIVRRLRILPVELKIALDFGEADLEFVRIGRVGVTNFASIQMKPISEWNILLKACEDFVLASISLLIFMPAMTIIALAIKLDSKGPVFFRQYRHGFNHRVFKVMKFRTMTVLEDGDQVRQATKNDRRVTRVGRFLRKTSLDELPQLINVLRGEMSLVGPRPHALVHNDEFSQTLENYACRHRVKPGITGWAQVNGFRGEITGADQLHDRVRYDLEYIDRWSIWFDLQILFMTAFLGFVSKRAY